MGENAELVKTMRALIEKHGEVAVVAALHSAVQTHDKSSMLSQPYDTGS